MELPTFRLATLGRFMSIALLSYIGWNAFRLLQHIHLARKIGLNYAVFPFSGMNVALRLVLQSSFVRDLIDSLPEGIADRINARLNTTRWKVSDRETRRLGGAYLVVDPRQVTLAVAEPETIHEILSDHRRFGKPVHLYKILKFYGQNVVVTEGKEWAAHHKYTSVVFHERNEAVVWQQSLLQAAEVVQQWESGGNSDVQHQNNKEAVVPLPERDLMDLALHVISSAAFSVPLSFFSPPSASEQKGDIFAPGPAASRGYTFTFPDVLRFVSCNVLIHHVVLALPSWVAGLFSGTRAHKAASRDYRQYLRTLVETADTATKSGTLVHSLAQSRDASDGKRLTIEEIIGNLFVFGIAGHETTARTLHFALINIALHPEVQAALIQNIDTVLKDYSKDPTEWPYKEMFDRLTVPQFIMLETLRLYAPATAILKTNNQETTVTVDHKAYTIPKDTYIEIIVNSAHHDPASWGPDADKFDASRWDKTNPRSFLAQNDGHAGLVAAGLESNAIHRPKRGGKRFSLVEFVAVLLGIFKDHDVQLAQGPGETVDAARERVRRTLSKSYVVLTLGPGGKVPLVLRRRT